LLHKLLSKGIKLAPLLKAATLGDHVAVKDLMKHKPKPALCDNTGRHFLHYAVLNDFYNQQEQSPYKILIVDCSKQFADEIAAGKRLLAQQPVFLKESFFQAIQAGDQADVILLLQAKVSANVIHKRGHTPLHAAAEGGHCAVVALLLDSKANINALTKTTSSEAQTPLLKAILAKKTEVVRLLIARKADLEATQEGCTPLYMAAATKQVALTEQLLLARASPDVSMSGVMVPLEEILLKEQPLHPQNSQIIKLLKSAREDSMETAIIEEFFQAVQEGDQAAVKRLLEANISPDVRRETLVSLSRLIRAVDTNTPVWAAVRHDHIHILQILVDAKANPNTCVEKSTLLHLLATGDSDRFAMVDILVRAKADVNKTDVHGHSAVTLAIRKNHTKTVELLLDAKAIVMESEATVALPDQKTPPLSLLSAVLQSQSRDSSLTGLAETQSSRQATAQQKKSKSQAELTGRSITRVLQSDPSPASSIPNLDRPPDSGLQLARSPTTS